MIHLKSSKAASTVFMTACQPTQTAAETFIPQSKQQSSLLMDDKSEKFWEHNEKKTNNVFLNPDTGYALLIGINKYGRMPNLNGCLNDVDLVLSSLLLMGWRLNRIMILRDEDATKVDILNGLKWLVKYRKKNVSLFFHFSGHGSWTLANNGLGWECCICCFGCDKNWDNGTLTRSEFNSAISRTTVDLHVSLDSCFSGGMLPSYRSWKKIPKEAYESLYGSVRERRTSGEVRALTGPEWLTIPSASKRLNISRQQLNSYIKEGSIKTRAVLKGPLHVLI